MKKPVTHITTKNVFADLGLPDADELQAKSALVHQITSIIDSRKLTQVEAANLLGIDQPKISNLVRGRLEGFSTERLFRFLLTLGYDIDITVKQRPSKTKHSEIRVHAA